MKKPKRKQKVYQDTAKVLLTGDPYGYYLGYTYEDEELINVKPKIKPPNKYKS